jgi:hypothetical protein
MVVLSGTQGNLGAFWFDVVLRDGLCVRAARRGGFRSQDFGCRTPDANRHDAGQPHV